MPTDSPTTPPPIVVVGASAGGVEALRDLVAGLPAGFGATVLVVLHVPASATSVLPSILGRAGRLSARHARDGDLLAPGQILVAPPDHHLVVLGDRVSLTRGPQENGHRPAVDVLFRSAARAAGPRTHALVLSGALDDGAAGALAVMTRGGRCLVQRFDEAQYDSMPRAAADAAGLGSAGAIPVSQMPAALAAWLEVVPTGTGALDPAIAEEPDPPRRPAGFGCPDCAGVLYEIDEVNLRRYRCRVGHAWSPENLLAQQTVSLESALWMALRSLEEKASLTDEVGRQAAARGHARAADRFTRNAEETRRAGELVRRLVTEIETNGTGVGSDSRSTDA